MATGDIPQQPTTTGNRNNGGNLNITAGQNDVIHRYRYFSQNHCISVTNDVIHRYGYFPQNHCISVTNDVIHRYRYFSQNH